MDAAALTGRHIVVTRPAGQAAHLAAALARLGATPVLFPVFAILDIEDPLPLSRIAARLEEFDLAIFVSANAIAKALDVILKLRSWPAATRVATVGKSSELALAHYGLTQVVSPQARYDSESLLALPELTAVGGRRVVIFRGNAGRELLGDTLAARGAMVEYIECYRRAIPHQDASALLDLWSNGQLDAVTLTSSEGVRNFHSMIGRLGQAWLKKTLIFVPHARIAEAARDLGLAKLIITEAGDDGLIHGLVQYFDNHECNSSR